MNWFYAKDGQQAGPVDDAELDRLVGTGDIADSTLVWHSALSNWQPYSVARAGAGAGGVAVLPAAGAGTTALAPGQAQCSQCGRVLPADEVVRLENMDVCAECKPAFIQRLREGAAVGNAAYAGFGIRLGAAILDALILLPIGLLYGFAVGFFVGTHRGVIDPQNPLNGTFQAVSAVMNLLIYVFYLFYSAFCVSRFGGTPGKRICKLRVVRGDGGKVSFSRALGRYLAKILSKIILCIGYLFIIFDDQKRALHDMICDTRVIHDPN